MINPEDWKRQGSKQVWLYEALDLTSCVYREHAGEEDVYRWSVEGPGGRWTKASGAATTAARGKLEASLWMAGYRRARREAGP